jgi:hypothetical protein
MVQLYHDDLNHTSISPTSSSQIKESLCYFTYTPSPSNHWSLETPLPSPDLAASVTADPNSPLLALRIPLLSPSQTMEASKLFQLQTAAAHPQRSKPQLLQDVFEVSDPSIRGRASSESSSSSLSSSSSNARRVCFRCQTTYGEFVQYSLNSYYCTRCAKITGYGG